jgi:hypothetical protein
VIIDGMSPLVLVTLTGVAALSALAAGCGGSQRAGAATTTTPSTPRSASLAFARCMREHGVSRFPDPNSQGNFPPLDQQALGVSKQDSSAAQETCKHLLSRGGSTGTPQQRQQKLAFGLRVAQCLRTHGYPAFPDPTTTSQALPPGIDASSPRFVAAESACEEAARKALGLG